MFRRKWSGLPADPSFPEDLKELGCASVVTIRVFDSRSR